MSTITKIALAVIAGIALVFIGVGTPASAADIGISNPGQITQGAPGSEHPFGSTAVPLELQGRTCDVSVTTTNGESVHPNNDFIVTTGSDSGILADFEAESFATTTQAFSMVLGDTINLTLRLGEDGKSSAGVTNVVGTCPPETTVPETTVPETTIPETVPTIPDVCHKNGSTEILVKGSFEFKNAEDWGTHSISGLWCGPITTTTTTPAVTTTVVPKLPDTGNETSAIAVVAFMSLLLGGGALWAARR